VSLAPRVVIVTRRTELEELLARHSTRGQAAFFLSTRGRSIDELEARHDAQQQALARVSSAIPLDWRQGSVERGDLDRFLFAAGDVVVVVGQDGLVANVAKHLDGQAVIGVDAEPGRNPAVLVTHRPSAVAGILAHLDERPALRRSLVEAVTDDGQRLLALNEIYLGQPGQQTARYRVTPPGGAAERQASSGLLVGSGTGATGWCRSVWLERGGPVELPAPDEQALTWFVREAWPSPVTGTSHTCGRLAREEELAIESESDRLVVFGDGLETDALTVTWGQRVLVRLASTTLRHIL